MTEFILLITLFLLCASQFAYICHMKKQTQHSLEIIRGIRRGEQERIFVKGSGLLADLRYELNGIMEENQAQIVLLKKADEANKQIVTGLSHDVRTPLASLLGYLEALNKGLLRVDDEKEYIAVAYRKANDLKAFIDMLFEWFKISSNEQQFFFETTDINEATKEILIEWLTVLEQEKIELSVNISDDELMVNLDKTAYKRIVNNLLQNAVKHGDCTLIKITVRSCSDVVLVEVANNGHNILAQHLPYIFERMYKGDTSRSNKGSGLGLTIAKELVTALQGEISVSSVTGKNTVFSVTFPILK